MTPRRIETSLVVADDFTDSTGGEWRAGDRAPLARRAIREAATERPELFRVEFETLEFDPEADWFRDIVADYERRNQELKRHRDADDPAAEQNPHMFRPPRPTITEEVN